jgi:ABC-type antimicrobial peptide transport system permease subunit
MNPSPPQSGAFIAKLGAWLQLAQFIGLVGTIIGMRKAFSTLKTSGTGDPEILSGAIGEVLISSAAGIAVSFIGVLLVLFAVTACRYRSVWMFWFLCLYGGLITFSYFLPFGLFFLIFALMKKDEFLRPQAPAVAA